MLQKVLLQHYFSIWVKFCYLLSFFSKKSRSKWVFGKYFSQNPIFLYFCIGTEFHNFCEGACHYDVTEANLVSMFTGHSELTIGTKINIRQGFILKIWGWGGNHPLRGGSCY